MTRIEGFTLLETMIAMSIMVVAFGSILMVESASINTSTKAKQMIVVAMLAKRTMIESEYKFEGKTFAEFKKEESGTFEEPWRDYQWTRLVKEIEFPQLAIGSGSGDGETTAVETMTKLLTKFLSKAVREVTVKITWKKGSGEQSFAVSTYWVDLNHAMALSE